MPDVGVAGLTAKDNAKWMAILTPNATKYKSWIRRVIEAFRSRVAAAKADGKAPSLRTRAVRRTVFTNTAEQMVRAGCGTHCFCVSQGALPGLGSTACLSHQPRVGPLCVRD